MKILYISNSIIPSRTANSIHVMKMCHAFANNDHQVILVAPDNKDKYEKKIGDVFDYYAVKKNFKIKKLWHPGGKLGTFFYSLSIFFYLLFNRNFDLVYGRFLYGCYFSALLGKQIVFEAHAPIYEEHKLAQKVFNLLIKNKNFKKIVVISQALKDMYLQNLKIKSSNIVVVHDGADEVINFSVKKKLYGKEKNLKVGYVGHLYKGKGLEVIESIASRVSKDVEFHILGGIENDINYWKKKIKRSNVFFYGYVSHKSVGQFINSLDVCLLPNQEIVLAHGGSEGGINISKYTSPLKLFEYMSHKKPIISSDIPVLREILNDKNSLLVKHDSVEGWIKSIESLKNPSLREKISSRALNDFKKYTWKKRAQIITSILNRKKITILISTLSGGGAEGVSVNVANSFAEDNFKVDLVVLHLKNASYIDRISKKVNLIVLNVSNARYSFFSLLKYIRKFKPTIMFIFNYELTALVVMMRKFFKLKIKIIARNMNTYSKSNIISKEKNFWNRFVVKFLIDKFFSQADHIVNQSYDMQKDLINFRPTLAKKSSVIFNPVASYIENYSKSLNFNQNIKKNYLLIVGRLEKQKGLHFAIEAFSQISKKFPNLRLKIVGQGKLEQELRQQTINCGVSNLVDFEGFQINMIPYYVNAKATILTSLYEGYPNVLIESIFLGTPVVAFDCQSGPREIIKDDINGYLVNNGDIQDLIIKISKVLLKNFDQNRIVDTVRFNQVSNVYKLYKNLIYSFIKI